MVKAEVVSALPTEVARAWTLEKGLKKWRNCTSDWRGTLHLYVPLLGLSTTSVTNDAHYLFINKTPKKQGNKPAQKSWVIMSEFPQWQRKPLNYKTIIQIYGSHFHCSFKFNFFLISPPLQTQTSKSGFCFGLRCNSSVSWPWCPSSRMLWWNLEAF